MTRPPSSLSAVAKAVAACDACPRLARYCTSFQSDGYWGRGVPGFGDRSARLLVLGLAPGAHGANRTGRPFTGDAAGELLYRALHASGLASAPIAVSADDGLALRGAYITNVVKCAPPQNRPTPAEIHRCAMHLSTETDLLREVRVILALGRVAHDAQVRAFRARGAALRQKDVPFGHGSVHRLADLPVLVDSFHPSRYNVNVGKLTDAMFRDVVRVAWNLAAKD